jgi:hypothetical protein
MDAPPAAPDRAAASRLLGYLNFSDGRPDPRFQRQLDDAASALTEPADQPTWRRLARWLTASLEELHAAGSAAFTDVAQARAALRLTFDAVLPAYRRHHADLLAHLGDEELFPPFFVARAFEAVLAEKPAAVSDDERFAARVVRRLNDFVGYRPVAVLETRAKDEFYDHEQVRPVPLWLAGAGVGSGRYRELVGPALDVIRQTDPHLLHEAGFDPQQLEELALDPRAYDHHHPANRRPNHVFGEWDPHRVDNQGRYRRFVLRQATLDALLERVTSADPPGTQRAEYLAEAAAVLAGTVLMAAGLTGAGPGAHDSGTSLATLVPRIARYRDAFYTQLINRVVGGHGQRLRAEAAQLRQPFAGARQHLNAALARQRAAQLQDRHLALLFAEMGFADASRERVRHIPTASVRLLSEIRLRLTGLRLAADRGDRAAAAALVPEVEDLIRRGVACGALPDPWNVLGFQGLYPLSPAREDSVRDPRLEELLDVMARLFDAYGRLLAEAAAAGDREQRSALSRGLRRQAAEWDRYATSEVSDLPRVHGGERAAAAEHVASALAAWRERGEGAGDIAFWRQKREGFRTPEAFARVVEALLRQRELRAAMALLMTWLDQADEVPPEVDGASFGALAERWLTLATDAEPPDAGLVRKFFEYLEANAGPRWEVPGLGGGRPRRPADDEDDSSDVFGAAYEGVTYRDSTDDGGEGAVIGDAPAATGDFPLEFEAEQLTGRLRFLGTVARLWRTAAALPSEEPAWREALEGWLATARRHRDRLVALLDELHDQEIPKPLAGFDSVIEYDRRRVIKEQVLEAALATTLEAARAARALGGASPNPPSPFPDREGGAKGSSHGDSIQRPALEPGSPPSLSGKGDGGLGEELPWESAAVPLERALRHGDAAAVRAQLPGFLEVFQNEPLLFVPLAEGGHPRQVLRARLALAMVQTLLERLPRLGLIRETYHLVKTARAMERNSPSERKLVTEFDRLFQIALPGVVAAVLRALRADPGGGEPTELLRRVVDSFLALWIAHSQTLRLSVLEPGTTGDEDWQALRDFIGRYGGDLFTAQFLTLANLRGVLHRGLDAYLDSLAADADPNHPPAVVEDLLSGRLPRGQAVRHLQTVLQAVIENYEEYRDYNTTTTQSDYGENLYQFLDLLRVKAAYERYAWRMRPLVLAHEVLCRHGESQAAERWRENMASFTLGLSNDLLAELGRREEEYGIRLRTVRDRLEERFRQPLLVDRLCAAVAPALREAAETGGAAGPAFRALEGQLAEFTANPTGVGLDVPHWLRRLEAEVERLRAADRSGRPERPETGSALTVEDLRRQLDEWDRPLGE